MQRRSSDATAPMTFRHNTALVKMPWMNTAGLPLPTST
jgi:hypothetical protein